MKNSMLTAAQTAKKKPARKAAAEKPMRDEAFSRNFTKGGRPKLNATSGKGRM